jgi:hypothetical protein
MQENTVAIVACMRRRDDRLPLRKLVSTWQVWRDKESSVKYGLRVAT